MPVVSLRGVVGTVYEIGGLQEYEPILGDRDTGSTAYDELDIALREWQGVGRLLLTRVVGPGAVKASKVLLNSTPTTALTLTAVEYGAYWNATTIACAVSGGNFVLTVVEPDGTTYVSPTLADLDAAVAWVGATASTGSLPNFTMAKTGSTDPVTLAAAALTGGDDDRASITETQRATARNLFERSYGVGTHLEPGVSATASVQAIAAYCEANNRIAEITLPDTLDDAATTAAVDALIDTAGGDRVKVHRSWADVPGVTPGTTRTVGWSCIEAGRLGYNDDHGVPVGQPAAGVHGASVTALSLTTDYSITRRATLNDHYVNVAINDPELGIMGFGNRSLSTTPGEVQFGMARTRMVIEGQCESAGKLWVHKLLGGDLHELETFKAQLISICREHRIAGSLLGATDDDAFRVYVREVNTTENLLEGILYAAVDILPAGASEFVRINITAHAEAIGA